MLRVRARLGLYRVGELSFVCPVGFRSGGLGGRGGVGGLLEQLQSLVASRARVDHGPSCHTV